MRAKHRAGAPMAFFRPFIAIWLLTLLATGFPVHAAETSPALAARAGALVDLFNHPDRAQAMFTSRFSEDVPRAEMAAISKELVNQFGSAKTVERIEAKSPTSGVIFVDFARALVRVELTIEASPPYLITSLLITNAQMKSDSFAAIQEEFARLPGRASFAVARLGAEPIILRHAYRADEPLAIGSTFKLFLLAELDRQIQTGERKWSDVVHFSHRSVVSGTLTNWPDNSPMTLHTLAGLMISQSDNGASDTMLHLLGRERVEALLPSLGIADSKGLRPLLTTREAAMLKAGGNEALLSEWIAAPEADRRRLLPRVAVLPLENLDISKLIAAPVAIDSVEWFASTNDLVRVMNWLRVHGGPTALDILAINPGMASAVANQFAYIGYKGGSETGVMNMTFLLRSKDGKSYAVAGSWNDAKSGLDERRFQQLMTRIITLLR